MKFTWRTELPALAILAVMWMLAAIAWPLSPERVPVHWGLDGHPDGWGGRAMGLLMTPAVATVMYLVFCAAPLLDPGGANYARFAGAFVTLRFAVLAFMGALYGVTLAAIRGAELDMTRFILPLSGALLVVIGNLLGKLRPNWFMGVRTPWTLSSKLSWSRTHRAAGWVFVVGGLLLAAAGFSRAAWLLYVALGGLAAGVVWVIFYSWSVWKRDPDKVAPAGTTPTADG